MLRQRIFAEHRSGLHLPPCLIDVHRDLQSLAAASETCPAHRSGTKIVEADRNTYMRIGRANSVCRVEANPSKSFYIHLRPGMPGVLKRDAVGTTKVSSDISCGEIERPRSGNKDVRDILADAA